MLRRSDVDTDQIIPKQFLKRVERTGFGEFLFYDWAKEPGWDLDPNPILVTGRNFGCGSSREHAPWALEDFGFKALVAPSFADIFYSNCTKVGLLPVPLPEAEVEALMDAEEAEIDLEDQVVRFDGREVPFEIDPETRRRLLGGLDDIGVTLQSADAIDAFEARPRARRPRDHEPLTPRRPRDWDAATYDRVSAPQVAWAEQVLDRLALEGHETVLDAGCGSGRVTAMLADRLPRGRVIAVDAAPSMVALAREALGDRAEVHQAELTELELAEPVDAVFSNAVFHWVQDHDALFAALYAALRAGRAPGGAVRRLRERGGLPRGGPGGGRARSRTRATWAAGRGHGTSRARSRRASAWSGPASSACGRRCSHGRCARPSPWPTCARCASGTTSSSCPSGCGRRSWSGWPSVPAGRKWSWTTCA